MPIMVLSVYAALVVWAVRDGRDAAEQIDGYLQRKETADEDAPAVAAA